MLRFPRSTVASAAIALLVLSGCSSTGDTRQPDAEVTAISNGRSPIAESDSPADIVDQRHESLDKPSFTLRFPEVRGADTFNQKIGEFVADLRSRRLPDDDAAKKSEKKDAKTSEPTAGSTSESTADATSEAAGEKKDESGEYTLDWQVTQNSKGHISFLFHDRSTLPGATPEGYYTKVLDRAAGTEIPTADLFTKSGSNELAEAVLQALQHKGYKVSAQDAEKLSSEQRDAILAGTTVNGRGGLVTHLGSGVVNAAGDDPVAVSFEAEQAQPWLTDAGRKWLDDSAPGPRLAAGESMPEKVTRERKKVDCAVSKCVALTYDDGPGEDTPRLLDSLAKEGVPATFFVLGRSIAGHEDALKRMADEGHEIGSHTWSHPQLNRISKDKAKREHERVNSKIEEVTGQKPTVFRPPYGAFRKGVPDGGLPSIIWSVDTNDWQHKGSPQKTVQGATSDARPGDIILMHDIHKSSVDATPEIIKKLKEQGFELVTVSELFGGDLKAGRSYYSDERMKGSRHIPAWAG